MLLEERKSQIFPTLTPHQMEFAVRFASGPARSFEAGENIFNVGDRNAGVWLVAEGGIIATRRDGLGREQLFATCGPGQFSGEVSELGGQASLAAACAAPEGCVAYPFDEGRAHRVLARPVCDVQVQLGRGSSAVRFLTTDLTAEYVRINADYST